MAFTFTNKDNCLNTKAASTQQHPQATLDLPHTPGDDSTHPQCPGASRPITLHRKDVLLGHDTK